MSVNICRFIPLGLSVISYCMCFKFDGLSWNICNPLFLSLLFLSLLKFPASAFSASSTHSSTTAVPQPFNKHLHLYKQSNINEQVIYDYVVFILCIESTLCVNDQVDFVCEMLVHLLIIIWNVQHWFVVQNSVLYLMSKESLTVPLVWIKSVFSHISFYFEVWGNNAHMTSRTFTSRT